MPIVQQGQTRQVPVISLFSSQLVTPAQLPAFVGGDCVTGVGQVSIGCGTTFGRLATVNTWQLQQTFQIPPVFQGLTGYLKGNGTSPLTSSLTVALTDLAGTWTGDLAGSDAQSPTVLPYAPRGSVLFKTAGGVTGALAPNTAGFVLTSNGPGADPTMLAPGAYQIPPIHYAGQTIMMRSPNCPSGSLPENGASFSPTTYPQLYAAIGTTWGGTSSAPLLPNSGGYFDRGWMSGQSLDASRTFGTAQADQVGSHSHSFSGYVAYSQTNVANQGVTVGGQAYVNASAYNNNAYFSGTTAAAGGNETRPQSITAYHCIFTANSP